MQFKEFLRRNKSYFAFQYTFIQGRNRQFEAIQKGVIERLPLNACDVNRVANRVIPEIPDWRHRLLGPVPHKARFLLREPGFWSLVKNRDSAQIPFFYFFLHVVCFYFLKRKILAKGYKHFEERLPYEVLKEKIP